MPVLSVARLNETVVVVEKAVNEKLISEFDRAIPSGLVAVVVTVNDPLIATEMRTVMVEVKGHLRVRTQRR